VYTWDLQLYSLAPLCKRKTWSPSQALRPIGRRWSPFPKALSQTPVFTLLDHGYGASVSRSVPVYVAAVKPVPNYTAWWQRHMCVNNLPKVITRQCPGAESNLHPQVTSGLQVRHITVRLPSHTFAPLATVKNLLFGLLMHFLVVLAVLLHLTSLYSCLKRNVCRRYIMALKLVLLPNQWLSLCSM